VSSPPDLSLGLPDPADTGVRDPGRGPGHGAPRPARAGAPRHPARAALGVLARCAAAVIAIALLALPLWLAVSAEHRPVVVRLAAALVIAAIAGRIIGAARRQIEGQPPSALDRAASPTAAEASIPREYRDLAEEIHYGRMSHGYWIRVLEPRLAALAARLPGALPLAVPPRSAPRRLLRLGPSLAALRAAVARLEGRQ